jgi:hypothetical protein
MNKGVRQYNRMWLFLLVAFGCVKPYEPEVLKSTGNLLVVDGIINCAPNSETTIRLTRTRKLSDTVASLPELYAQVFIEEENGPQYLLQGKDSGIYLSAPLTLSTTGRYRLKINTSDGAAYASDFAPVKLTPPIDSLTWRQQGNDITIYVNTHDPQNRTRYYRWEYDETWQYATPIEATLYFRNGRIEYRTDEELTKICWKFAASTNILQQSTVQLSEDIVRMAPVAELSSQDLKFERKYSINVKQFALTKEAYEYWQIVKKNTQELGSIFDVQPSQLIGNLHCLTKADEPVIGYITAATVQEKRIFIRRIDITNAYSPQSSCKSKIIPVDSAAFYLTNPPYVIGHYVGSGGGAVAITTLECIDCRLAGGTIIKPSYWQ